MNSLPAMETLTTSVWSTERIPPEYRDIVPPTTGQQKALFIAVCKLAEISGTGVQSMSRIAISQAMLALYQLREMPAVKKAIPIFELVLSRKKLYDDGPGPADAPQVCTTSPPDESPSKEAERVPRLLQPDAELVDVPGEYFDAFVQDFLEYDAVGKWDF
ncbi:hypothetical protein MY11210_002703 [Beauveria gryllotalpidicola]